MNLFKRNLIIGAVLTVVILMVMAWDSTDAISRDIPNEPTDLSINLDTALMVARAEMNSATGMCLKTAMGKGLDPETHCDIVDP